MQVDELSHFRLVGGTAIALQIGHRKSIDIDLFSNQKADLTRIAKTLGSLFRDVKNLTLTDTHISVFLNGVRVDIYDDWHIPFLKTELHVDGIRVAALEDLAAFKLSSLIGRRDKKDYIDLFFLFKLLGGKNILSSYKQYEPLLSEKSIVFALNEAATARDNSTPLPDMLQSIDWDEIIKLFLHESRNYFQH